MSISDIDIELQIAKTELGILQDGHTEFNVLFKGLLKIQNWLTRGNAPKQLIEATDETGAMVSTNQEDFDLYQAKELFLAEMMDLLEISYVDLVGILVQSGNEGFRQLAEKYRHEIITQIGDHVNKISNLQQNLISAMYTYHNIEQ